jgi:hypothetical protein
MEQGIYQREQGIRTEDGAERVPDDVFGRHTRLDQRCTNLRLSSGFNFLTKRRRERIWGAPRIQGELLKLGYAVAQSTVAKYMAKRDNPSGQRWGTFLRNHAPHIAAMDLFVVPTIGFAQLYILVIVRLARRELVWINVTRHPTAEWIAQQITEAFPWNEVPTLPDPGPGRDLWCRSHTAATRCGQHDQMVDALPSDCAD